MKMKHLLTATAVVANLYGGAFVVAPVALTQLYGVTLTPGATMISRLFGAALLGIGLIAWFLRGVEPASPHLRAVALSLFISETIGFLVYLQAMLAGAVNALGWGVVAIYGFFAAGYGYFAFSRRR